MEKIKVLIVDDSAVVRKVLTEALSKSKLIEVVGTALDPYIAADKIKKMKPDVVTLDIEMPRMDGLTFLEKLMKMSPLPVIMVSSVTDKGAKSTIKALSLGAVDFILKPNFKEQSEFDSFAEDLIEKVISISRLKLLKRTKESDTNFTADVIIPKKSLNKNMTKSNSLVAIGASTGGTEVIADIIKRLPEDAPGILITQHMPEKFTKSFAERINALSKLNVKEAENHDRIYRGTVLIAPGGRHMLLKGDHNGGYVVEVNDGPPVNRHKPSVDVLFRSFAQTASQNSVGILLTGMGSDGARGLLEIKEAGISTIAQDEASCVIFGMPAEAIKLGAATMIKSTEEITSYIKKMN